VSNFELVIKSDDNIIKRVIGIIINPGRTMDKITKKPDLLGPILLSILSSTIILSRFSLYKEALFDFYENNPDSRNYTKDYIIEKINSNTLFELAISPIIAILILFILSFVVYKIIKFLGGKGNYIQIVSIFGYSYFFTKLISGLIIVITSFLTGEINLYSSPTSLVEYIPYLENNSFLYGFLKPIELFYMWALILLGIGIMKVSELKKNTIIYLVITIEIFVMSFSGLSQVALKFLD
jgi:hypothetical protein